MRSLPAMFTHMIIRLVMSVLFFEIRNRPIIIYIAAALVSSYIHEKYLLSFAQENLALIGVYSTDVVLAVASISGIYTFLVSIKIVPALIFWTNWLGLLLLYPTVRSYFGADIAEIYSYSSLVIAFGIVPIITIRAYLKSDLISGVIDFLSPKKKFKSKAIEKELNNIENLHSKNPSKAGYMFQDTVEKLLLARGFVVLSGQKIKNPTILPPGLMQTRGDGGIDHIAYHDDVVYVVQDKYKFTKIKGEDVSKLIIVTNMVSEFKRSKGETRVIKPLLVTNSTLDNTAIAYAKEHDVLIICGEEFKNFAKESAIDSKKAA